MPTSNPETFNNEAVMELKSNPCSSASCMPQLQVQQPLVEVKSSELSAPCQSSSSISSYTTDWRNTNLSWLEQMKFLYETKNVNNDDNGANNSELPKDVSFLVGKDGEMFQAHSFILQCRSVVFYKLIQTSHYGALISRREEDNMMTFDLKPIRIADVEPDTFQSLIQFAYIESLDTKSLDIKSAFDLILAAKKFRFRLLELQCQEYIVMQINPESAINIYKLANEIEDEELQITTLSAILRNGEIILKSEDFLTLSISCLKIILQSDDLQAPEIDIFQAVLRWAINRCKETNIPCCSENLRICLESAHTLIRFPLIDSQIILEVVKPSGLLSDAEMLEVTYFLLSQNESSLKTFSNKSRTYLKNTSLQEDQETISDNCLSPASSSNNHATAEKESSNSEMDEISSPSARSVATVRIQRMSQDFQVPTPNLPKVGPQSKKQGVKRKLTVAFEELPSSHPNPKPSPSFDGKYYALKIIKETPKIMTGEEIKRHFTDSMKEQNISDFNQIDRITLENVLIKKLRRSNKSIIFPNLKEYDIFLNTSSQRISADINIEDYLFIKTEETALPDMNARYLWNQPCNISLWQKSTQRFKLNPSEGELTVNFESFETSTKVLEELSSSKKLKKLSLFKCSLDSLIEFSSINLNLTELILHRVQVDCSSFKDFLQKCNQLKTFCWTGYGNKSTIDISRDLQKSSKTLRHLALCNLTISCSSTKVFPVLGFIHLDLCFCHADFEKKIQHIAPKLEEIWIRAHHSYVPNNIFADSLVKIKELERISISYVDQVDKCYKRDKECGQLVEFINNCPLVSYNPHKVKISKEGFSLKKMSVKWNFLASVDGNSSQRYFNSFNLNRFFTDLVGHKEASYTCKHRNCPVKSFNGNIELLCLHEQGLDYWGSSHDCDDETLQNGNIIIATEERQSNSKNSKEKQLPYEIDPDYRPSDNPKAKVEEESFSSESEGSLAGSASSIESDTSDDDDDEGCRGEESDDDDD